MASSMNEAVSLLKSRLATLDSDETLNANPELKEETRKALTESLGLLQPVETAWMELRASRVAKQEELRALWESLGLSGIQILDRLMGLHSVTYFGDHMPIEDFVECVRCGGFIDYDGSGNYATADYESNRGICPSEVFPSGSEEPSLEPGWTHVVWYNR